MCRCACVVGVQLVQIAKILNTDISWSSWRLCSGILCRCACVVGVQLVQIAKILNTHVDSLQWIDHNTGLCN